MTLEMLRAHVRCVEPAALLIEPRILRRVIRLDRRLPGLGLTVPHRKSYTIDRDRLLVFVQRSELDLPMGEDLPRHVILLATPEDESADAWESGPLLARYSRLLFHAAVHAELEDRLHDDAAPEALAEKRRQEIGPHEFAEIRNVLLKDDLLFPGPSDLEAYVEFVAVYLELRYFASERLPIYFPAIRDWNKIDAIVSQDVDHAELFGRLQLQVHDSDAVEIDSEELDSELRKSIEATGARLTLLEFRRYQAAAERASVVGNGIKAAIKHMRAAARAPAGGYAEEAHAAAHAELGRFCWRLQAVLELSDDETIAWRAALAPLLAPAAEGFWSIEARLLYDLQKVCVEYERGVYRLDLIDWIRTWGERPVRRPLPLLREALVIRHLRTAHRRVAAARITGQERNRLDGLLEVVVGTVETRSRDHLRPMIVQVLDEVGLTPQDVPEEVARRKLVEELLDRVVENSYLSMADLRDALSKNDLKLPDVLSVNDLLNGDRLLRADKKLDRALDGVYRRGAMYQRWPQTLSSLAFGTSFGRFLTRHLALPFGGAYLTLEFLRHVLHWFEGKSHDAHELLPHEPTTTAAPPEFAFYGAVFFVGMWLYLLIHRSDFRAWNVAIWHQGLYAGRKVFFEVPSRVLRSELVQRILHSHAFRAFRNYLLRPGLVTSFVWLLLWGARTPWSPRATFELFLVVSLFMNSPVGRTATEVTIDFLVRAWHELRMRVLAGFVQWIVMFFHGLAVALERVVYTVDEWLRFRAGDSRIMQSVKLVGGVAWFFIAYVVVFVFTLLVEPQVNPIKHFPVVTVAHKLILPFGPAVVNELVPYIGRAQANTLVWTTIWLIPGVFGFLVWELKENWRLYAANRSRTLRREVIGSHGETMVQLLRPGFHSGTLPKAYAALRRASRRQSGGDLNKRLHRKQAVLHHASLAVQRFVERELINLLEEANFLPAASLHVGAVRTATNRIDVELWRWGHPDPALLTWEDDANVLSGAVTRAGWIGSLSNSEQKAVTTALAGVFQRAGVERVRGDLAVPVESVIAWEDWVNVWSPAEKTPPLRRPVHADNSASVPLA